MAFNYPTTGPDVDSLSRGPNRPRRRIAKEIEGRNNPTAKEVNLEETKKIKAPRIGEAITYTDELGQPHDALVSAVWGAEQGHNLISVNLYFIDPDQQDEGGAATQLRTSVPHQQNQAAPGSYWLHKEV